MKAKLRNCKAHFAWQLSVLIGLIIPQLSPGQPGLPSTPVITNKFYSPSGKWIQVSNTNCVIWNSFPKSGESVTWSGGVRDGKAHGKGTVQWFTNGIPTTSYNGELKQGLSDGYGTSKGSEEHAGEWSKGSLLSTNGTIKYSDGNWYKGEIKDGFKMGQGEELMKGGVKYIGQFRYDRFHGKGEMVFPSGDKITGQWRDSKLEGAGTYHRSNEQSIKVKQTEAGIVPF